MLGHQLCLEFVRSSGVNVLATTRHGDMPVEYKKVFPEFNNIKLYALPDARDDTHVEKLISEILPEVVINAIGVIKQSKLGKQALQCIDINARLPHLLAQLCELKKIKLIHFSTDCVFSGKLGCYQETDSPDPIDIYGKSKFLGEVSGEYVLTIRTSIVGWELKGFRGLFEWFSRQRGRTIKGYTKVIYSGLTTTALAKLSIELLKKKSFISGLWQIAGPSINKYNLLTQLKDTMGWQDILIEPDDHFICDRSLCGKKFTEETRLVTPSWDEMLEDLKSIWPQYKRLREIPQIGEKA